MANEPLGQAGQRLSPNDRPGDGKTENPRPWRATTSGFCASFVCIGLGRFAYSPLLPALIDARWFSASSAAYLGAANLAGYLLGVTLAGRSLLPIKARWMLRIAMLLTVTSLFACAWQLGFLWFFIWRLLSGVAGGAAMILAAPTILPHVHPTRHGLISGAIFTGIGLGIALSGVVVPIMLTQGLPITWLSLGIIAAFASLIGWGGWPAMTATVPASHNARPAARALWSTSISYGFNAFGLVPHMVFLVAFVSQGLQGGIDAGTRHWVVFGLGAITGPILLGHFADRVGTRLTMRLTLLLEACFVALPAVSTAATSLFLSSAIVGVCTIGIVPIVLGRTREILVRHPFAQPAAWRRATTCFAIFQAMGAYALSFVFDLSGHSYRMLFLLGASAMVVGLIVELSGATNSGKRDSEPPTRTI